MMAPQLVKSSFTSSENLCTVLIKMVVLTDSGALKVEGVDMCRSDNGVRHHTSEFDVMTREKEASLVVRRGQNFSIEIHFSRPYNPNTDVISFVFAVASDKDPKQGKGSLVIIPLTNAASSAEKGWEATYDSHTDNSVKINIKTCPASIVAQWMMEIDTSKKGDRGKIASYKYPSVFYLLFNPWNSTDDVYMKDESHLQEYVLLDKGLIWKGSSDKFSPRHWTFDQFEKDILDCSLHLMENIGGVRVSDRGNPILVSRALSAAVNSNNDRGVLIGNWKKKIIDGTAPSKWTGSLNILKEYIKTKAPVKYGQCWVYAGVLTTVCRALGLPCRVVTNFKSAHDYDGSTTIDHYVDDANKGIDMVWNFHVWNEIWMKRPDLPQKYSGWQVLDATPQEISGHIYQCGPASVVAVKLGDVQFPYDCKFVYSEVNADEVYWKRTPDSAVLKLIRTKTTNVGQFISTKTVGKWEREDITENYKYAEDSKDERYTALKVLKNANTTNIVRYYIEEFSGVYFSLAPIDSPIKIGEAFNMVLNVTNQLEKQYTVRGKLIVTSTHYNGRSGNTIKTFAFKKVVNAKSSTKIVTSVSFDEYYKGLLDQYNFNIACLARVLETEYEYFKQNTFSLQTPDVKISASSINPTVGQPLETVVEMQNSLPIKLTECGFIVIGVQDKRDIKVEDILPGKMASVKFSFVPLKPGQQTIFAKFYSKELNNAEGFLPIFVN